MYRYILALVATLMPYSAHANVIQEWNNGWQIRTTDENCFATRVYENDDHLVITYDPTEDKVMMSISDPDATSLRAGQTVDLHVIFVSPSVLDDGWGVKKFTVAKHENGLSQMIGVFEGRVMLNDLSRYDVIAFSIDGTANRMVGSYSLDGSAKAMSALKTCAFAMYGLNPNDPFIQ